MGMFRPTSQGFVLRVRPKVHQEHEVAVSLISVILSIGHHWPILETPWKPRPNSEMSAAAVNAYANRLAWEEAGTV